MASIYDNWSYVDLEQLSNQLWAEIQDIKQEYRKVAAALNEKREQDLRDNPPDPGMVIGR